MDTARTILAEIRSSQFIPRSTIYRHSQYGKIDSVIYNLTGAGNDGSGVPFVRFEATRYDMFEDNVMKLFDTLPEAFAFIRIL